MSKQTRQKIFFISFFVMLMFVFFAPQISLAAGPDVGLEYGEAIGLSSTDPRIVISRLIQIALGFLGIIAVGLIMYAGFLWMTSGGNEEQVTQAKNTIKNAVIGLVIILASFAITTFILNSILDATGGGGSGSGSTVTTSTMGGIGSMGACIVERVYPTPNQTEVARNTSIIITFKEEIDSSTICDVDENGRCTGGNILIAQKPEDQAIRIYKTKDDRSNFLKEIVVYDTEDKKTFVFMPKNYLGSPSEYLWYTVYLSNDVSKQDGEPAFDTCHSDFLEWQFEVSNKIDLTPPQVQKGGLFPPKDNFKDTTEIGDKAVKASGSIYVKEIPKTFIKATSTELVTGGVFLGATATADEYNKQEGDFKIVVLKGDITAQLSKGNKSIGTADFDGNKVVFKDILTLEIKEGKLPKLGNFWEFTLGSRVEADKLTIAGENYIFVKDKPLDTELNKIQIGVNIKETRSNIIKVIKNNEKIIPKSMEKSLDGIVITAKIPGEDGNNIRIVSSDQARLAVFEMKNGADKTIKHTKNDAKDQPMNSIIQINFNEAILPITITGSAKEVANTIRVVNNNGKGAGIVCSNNNDCLSFKCEMDEESEKKEKKCVNSSLAGEFKISNAYKTIEFISDNKCGVNGCGEAIYCLPENSNLRVELAAAPLIFCQNDCATKSPFTKCEIAGKTICQDSEGHNYPASNISSMQGIMDTAINSLDGNRDGDADGAKTFYNENNQISTKGDHFLFSFFINEKMETTPPIIKTILPAKGGFGDFVEPVEILFDKLLMSSSLQTGQVEVDNGKESIWHKALNIWDVSGLGVGYWVEKEDLDLNVDGANDQTKAFIKHSMLSEGTNYRVQVGSNTKDIYQNCFKPSDGVYCSGVSEATPSCCDGIAIDELDADGNCN